MDQHPQSPFVSTKRSPVPRAVFERLLGRWGMEELVEPRVRGLVLAHLAIGADAIEALAWPGDTHALEVLALAGLVEGALGIDIPERLLDHVESYRMLVDVVVGQLMSRVAAGREPVPDVVWISAVARSADAGAGMVRAGRLTTYLAETIMDDAHLGRPGARLDVGVAREASDDDIVTVRTHFARLALRGTPFAVQRHGEAPPAHSDVGEN